MKVAIVGGGIAGLAAAHALAGRHEVTLFEAAPRVGGHAYTVDGIDMGFIVFNRERYPCFSRLIDELGIATRATAMSFSVSHGDVEWSTAAPFAQRERLTDLGHWRLLGEVIAFLRGARRDLAAGRADGVSLADYLENRRVSHRLRERFAIPLAAALWSLAPDRCGACPAPRSIGVTATSGWQSR
jgi:predicted NAD/FAD-binding protein